MDYASLEVKKKKEKKNEIGEYVWVVVQTTTPEKASLPVPAQRFGKTLAEDNWFQLVSVQFDSVYSSWI